MSLAHVLEIPTQQTAPNDPMYLVCAAEYDPFGGGLSERGQSQIAAVRERALGLGIGRDAVILTAAPATDLSPNAPAVRETASALFAGGLGRVLVESDVIGRVARAPRAVRSLEHLIGYALDSEGIEVDTAAGILLVTQQPLMQPIKGHDEVRAGEILPFHPGMWPSELTDFFNLHEAVDMLGPDVMSMYPDRNPDVDMILNYRSTLELRTPQRVADGAI